MDEQKDIIYNLLLANDNLRETMDALLASVSEVKQSLDILDNALDAALRSS